MFPALVPVICKAVVVFEIPLVVNLESAKGLPVLTSFTVFVILLLFTVFAIPLVVTLDVAFICPPSSYTLSLTPVALTWDVVLLTLSDSDGHFPPLAVVVIAPDVISFLT